MHGSSEVRRPARACTEGSTGLRTTARHAPDHLHCPTVGESGLPASLSVVCGHGIWDIYDNLPGARSHSLQERHQQLSLSDSPGPGRLWSDSERLARIETGLDTPYLAVPLEGLD